MERKENEKRQERGDSRGDVRLSSLVGPGADISSVSALMKAAHRAHLAVGVPHQSRSVLINFKRRLIAVGRSVSVA